MENTDKSMDGKHAEQQSVNAGTGANTNGDLLDDELVNMPGMRVEGKVINVRGKDGKIHKNGGLLERGCIEERISDDTQRVPVGDAIASEKVSARDTQPGSKFVGTGWDDAARADTMAMVKHCTKDILLFGGLEVLFFYWQQTEQMVNRAAYPAIVVCATLAGLSIGINIGKYIHSIRSR